MPHRHLRRPRHRSARPGHVRASSTTRAAIHLLGTDRYGRDVLGLVLVGLPNSLMVAAIAGVISTVIGVVVGFVAGYKGGRIDAILRTFTDMFLVIPTLPLIFILARYSRRLSIPTPGAHPGGLQLALRGAGDPLAGPEPARATLRRTLQDHEHDRPRDHLPGHPAEHAALYRDRLRHLRRSARRSRSLASTVIGLGPSDTIDLGAIIFFAQGGASSASANGRSCPRRSPC